jgi:AbrB family looped-hinge helix DNA binding protein
MSSSGISSIRPLIQQLVIFGRGEVAKFPGLILVLRPGISVKVLLLPYKTSIDVVLSYHIMIDKRISILNVNVPNMRQRASFGKIKIGLPSEAGQLNGQITMPKAIRQALGVQPGSKIEFYMNENKEIIVRPISRNVDAVFGKLYRPGRKPVSVEATDDAIKEKMKARVRK